MTNNLIASQAPLLFITGAPAAGKSSLARALAVRIGAPLLFKDGIKESLYDQLVLQDVLSAEITKSLTEKLSAAAYGMLFQILQTFPSNIAVILEGDFRPTDLPIDIRESNRPMIEIHCVCDRDIRLQRHAARAQTDRHVVHCDDAATAETLKTLPDSVFGPHGFGTVHLVDTTTSVDIDSLVKTINSALPSSSLANEL